MSNRITEPADANECPLFHCKYLGSRNVAEGVNLDSLQEPLRDIYVESYNGENLEKNDVVTVKEDDIVFNEGQLNENKFPFTSVVLVESVKFIVKNNNRGVFDYIDESKNPVNNAYAFTLSADLQNVAGSHNPLICVVTNDSRCHVFALDHDHDVLHLAALIGYKIAG